LIGRDFQLQRALAQELQTIRTPMLRADSIQHAIDGASQFASPPSVLLVPEDSIRAECFEEQRAELQIRTGSPRLIPIAIGNRPDENRRSLLRQTGIHLALFGRFGRHALRFQINRALACYGTRAARGDLRAPVEWRTWTYSAGRQKAVRCYSLSIGGAYFVTPRPWIVGSEVSLELPIAGPGRLIDGRILYTKLTGDGERPSLPGGMAVAFRGLSPQIRNLIWRDLTKTRHSLEV
jgi:hypothetical protein